MADQPEKFLMTIQGGMLEALGINMYTSIGKCLVEFVANGYDSDAQNVQITIPIEEIDKAREEVRDQAKADADAGIRDKFTVLTVPLPDDIVIVVEDDGHGMSPDDVQDKFLPINRKRRFDPKTGDETHYASESGKRQVMGRKGLGKLAGFGAAEKVTVRTKRKGETFATTFEMDFDHLRDAPNIQEVPLPATYEHGLPVDESGTKVTLSRLKCDAVKYGSDAIARTLQECFFGVHEDDFAIWLNGDLIEQPVVAYEFEYPADRPHNGMARKVLNVGDAGTLTFDYVAKFRARKEDKTEIEGERGHLPAAKRGARIYCNGRLAAGPTLLELPTGMHNFHSQSYLECIVYADELDHHSVDLINTNRTQLREDNEVVSTFVAEVTEIMKQAIIHHGKYRDQRADEDIKKSERGAQIERILGQLPLKQRTPTRRVLKMLASNYGTESDEFTEMAPIIVESVNASDVLIRLIGLGTEPGSIEKISSHLAELADIERRDVLKLYRARRNGITALRKLIDRGYEAKSKGPHFEDELHELFKEYPWLIKPEYGQYVTSDAKLEHVASVLAKELEIDDFTPPEVDGKVDETRPDLVFLMIDSHSPHTAIVVELKSPSIVLNFDHLTQLKGYMGQMQRWLSAHLDGNSVTVHGYLIGQKPEPNTKAKSAMILLDEMADRGTNEKWEVLDLEELFDRAKLVHIEAIQALEAEEAEEAEEVGGDEADADLDVAHAADIDTEAEEE